VNESDQITSESTPPEIRPPSARSSVPGGREPPLEKVRKIYVRDLEPRDRLNTVFLVKRKGRNVGRSGKPYLTLVLSDKTGDVEGRIFEAVDALEPIFAVGDYVLVEGQVIIFHAKPQVLVEKLERLDPEPIDHREFASSNQHREPSSQQREPSRLGQIQQIHELVEKVQDPHVRALLLAFLNDPEIAEGLQRAPAAKGIHHAYAGGLGDHLLSVMKLAHRIADHYPMADRDLLVAGALLHDIGKVAEISHGKNFEYTDEGRLVGHLVMTAQKIREKSAQIPNFPKLLEYHITHLVLAHHGNLELGSPKVPMTLEALLVHSIDLMDARVNSWLEFMSKDPNEKWTELSKLYERHLWKGTIPTIRNKSPVEGRRRRDGGKRRGADQPAPTPEPKREFPEKKQETKEPDLPADLSFRPLSEIAPEPPEPPSAQSSEANPEH
jgi:3'-5' exoribonuclease